MRNLKVEGQTDWFRDMPNTSTPRMRFQTLVCEHKAHVVFPFYEWTAFTWNEMFCIRKPLRYQKPISLKPSIFKWNFSQIYGILTWLTKEKIPSKCPEE